MKIIYLLQSIVMVVCTLNITTAEAKPRPPVPPLPERELAQWRFDGPDGGPWEPLRAINLARMESWSGYALEMSGQRPALLALPAISSRNKTNLASATGTVRFWLAPNWTSVSAGGAGPGSEARLWEVGAWSDTIAARWWSVSINAPGTMMRFAAHAGTDELEVMHTPIEWCAGEWHQLALSWSPSETVLFLDGQRAAIGPGIALQPLTKFPGVSGFCLGSDVHGGSLAQAQFEELFTFARACSDAEVAENYRTTSPWIELGPVTPQEEQARLAQSEMQASSPESGGAQSLAANYGCALWLEISPAPPGAVRLVLRNTVPGVTYQILSKTDLLLPSWSPEKTVVGASGQDWTETTVLMNQRPTLFFNATEPGGFSVATSFQGFRNNDPEDPYNPFAINPPDTMGAAGPEHFVEHLNGVTVVFDKASGLRLEAAANEEVYSSPSGDLFDPQIIFDIQCQRWIACIVDRRSDNVILAVSSGPNATPLTSWAKYTIPMAETGLYADSPSLGADGNGIYIVVHMYPVPGGPSPRQKIVAISKQPTGCLGTILPNQIHVLPTLINPYARAVLRPAINFDSISSDAIAWFISKGPAQATPYQPGAVQYGRLKWINGTPQLLEEPWSPANTIPAPHPYFDADCTVSCTADCNPNVLCAKAKDSTPIPIWRTGSRFQNVVVRNGHLWACQHIGLNAQGGYNGETPNTLRVGCQWYRLRITDQSTLVLTNHARVYDSAGSSFYHYYMPSLVANCAGDMIMGFSGSRETEYIGAFYTGRLASGAAPSQPILLKAGEGPYADFFGVWGDYSATRVDPDGLSFWTVQEYAESETPPNRGPYGTWVAKIRTRNR